MYSYVILLQRYYFYLIYAINLMIPHYKEDGVHIVRGVYAMLQSITKVFISIGYVSVMYRLSYTQVARRIRGNWENLSKG